MNELLAPRTPGAALRQAREKCRFSIADVVESTRIKAHIIEALENDDYSVIAAPLYGKGFIKLYAELVGLDPAPLIHHYLGNYARSIRPTLKTEVPPPSAIQDGIPQPSPLARFKEPGGARMPMIARSVVMATQDLLRTLSGALTRLQASGRELSRECMSRAAEDDEPMPVGRYAAIGFAILVVIILVIGAATFLMGGKDTAVPPAPTKSVERKVESSRSLRLAIPPPAPYIKLK
jgi:hypothetical protein